MEQHYSIVSYHQQAQLRLAHDPYGIYANRILLSKVLPGVRVYRGTEWWHGEMPFALKAKS